MSLPVSRRSLITSFAALALIVSAAGFFVTAAHGAASPTTKPGERHPEIRIALRHLREAKTNLESAAHDYGGHRTDALKATESAIKECEAALAYDKE